MDGPLSYKSSHLVRHTNVLSDSILDWGFRLIRIANLQLDLYDWGHLFIKVIMATTQGLSDCHYFHTFINDSKSSIALDII